jgi:hypothetical protein
MAGTTGLEPATSDVTGRRSNQLSYVPAVSLDNQIVTRPWSVHQIARQGFLQWRFPVAPHRGSRASIIFNNRRKLTRPAPLV